MEADQIVTLEWLISNAGSSPVFPTFVVVDDSYSGKLDTKINHREVWGFIW